MDLLSSLGSVVEVEVEVCFMEEEDGGCGLDLDGEEKEEVGKGLEGEGVLPRFSTGTSDLRRAVVDVADIDELLWGGTTTGIVLEDNGMSTEESGEV